MAAQNAVPSAPHFLEYASVLTFYATEFRYPGDVFEPSLEDAEEALEMAGEFLSHARAALQGKLDTGQKN